MSQRHNPVGSPSPLKEELRARAHGERHRIHVELQSVAQEVSSGFEPDEVHEPGAAWRPERQHDSEVAKRKEAKRNRTRRHWKTKMWKRRTVMRQQKVAALRETRENGFAIDD